VKNILLLLLIIGIASGKASGQQFANSYSNDIADSILKLVKKDLNVDSVFLKKDTLSLLVHNKSLFYPFGKQKKITAFNIANKEYTIKKETAQGKITLHRLIYKNSFVKFVQDEENHLYQIVSAKIIDKEIVLNSGIHTGMPMQQILSILFYKNTIQHFKQVKVIELISALDGIQHYYIFKNAYLNCIVLNTDYIYNKN